MVAPHCFLKSHSARCTHKLLHYTQGRCQVATHKMLHYCTTRPKSHYTNINDAFLKSHSARCTHKLLHCTQGRCQVAAHNMLHYCTWTSTLCGGILAWAAVVSLCKQPSTRVTTTRLTSTQVAAKSQSTNPNASPRAHQWIRILQKL